MEFIIFYFIGYAIFGLSYFIYKTFFSDEKESINMRIYESLKMGLYSWFGIVIGIAIFITYWVYVFDDWMRNRLETFDDWKKSKSE